MTTNSWSSVVDHTSDAGFRAWGSELSSKFAAVGMVQTADTGQINWTTVTRPAVNVAAGYEIWQLSGAALTLKIEYGTQTSGATLPGMWVTVGTGSNGSGTLTGQLSTRNTVDCTSSVVSTATAYQSYLCATASFVGLAWKSLSASNVTCRFLFAVGLTVDATGSPTATGYYILRRTGGTVSQCTLQTVRTAATAATRNASISYCIIPGLPTASSDGSNNQIYLHWLDTPGVQPALYTGTIFGTELTQGNTITATLVGSSPHTYIAATGGASSDPRYDAANTAAMSLLMLWE